MEKRIFKIFSIILFGVVALIFLTSCTKKAWDYDNVVWYCDEPQIEITKAETEDWVGKIEIDGETYDVELLWGPSNYFYVVDCKSFVDTVTDEVVLFEGKVNSQKEYVELKIEKDNLLDNKYSSIKLYHRSIEK